jgi:hypothetical protein
MGLELVSLQDVKSYAGISSNNQDTQITALLPRVSDYIKSYCGRSFVDYVTTSKVEIVSGEGSFYIYTDEPRIIGIESLEISEDYGLTYTPLVEYEDYVLDISADRLQAIKGVFINKPNSYRITYTAGYDLLPDDLLQAAIDLCMYYLKNDMAVHSNKAPGTNSVQIEYITNASVPAHIARVLHLYKKDWN